MPFNKTPLALAMALFITACGGGGGSDAPTNNTPTPVVDAFKGHDLTKMQQLLNTNADIAYAVYSDAVNTAQQLKSALAALKDNPSTETLANAKKAWLVAREPYGQTEVYRFRLSPIDSTNYADEDGPEGAINAWPLGESLIDYVKTGTDFSGGELGITTSEAAITAGNTAETGALKAQADKVVDVGDDINAIAGKAPLVNIINSAIAINESLLANNTMTAGDERDVIAGYHAIEFLLWGQDLNNAQSADTKGVRELANNNPALANSLGGSRPVADFISQNANDAAARRHQYLEVAVDKLIADLTQVRDAWAVGDSTNYRAKFTTISTTDQGKQKMLEIITGMGTLAAGELAGERMQIALLNDSQEDEHSCFSDNTHRDIWLNAQGVSNAFYGKYAGYTSSLTSTTPNQTINSVNGYGIYQYLQDVGLPKFADEVKAKLTATEAAYTAIDSAARSGKTFDVLIKDFTSSDAKPVRDTITALTSEAKAIVDINSKLTLGAYSYNDAIADTNCADSSVSNNLCK